MQFRNAHILPCICYCLTVWISFLTWDRGSCACDIMSPSHALGYEVFHVLYLAEISSIVIKCHEMEYGNYCKIHIFFQCYRLRNLHQKDLSLSLFMGDGFMYIWLPTICSRCHELTQRTNSCWESCQPLQ